ncbi:hypothetical protein C8R43DRAFT_944580 [Mycena crocata]|nr:hypothetical protein C8R43DRAFT_944580 [Mycena crocata]
MFSKSQFGAFILSTLSISESVLGRPVWPENPLLERLKLIAIQRVSNPPPHVVRANAGDASASACPVRFKTQSAVTVTVSGTATGRAAATAVTVSVGSTSTAAANAIGNFGSCSVPQIEFGVGFDGRKETAFQPVDKASYNHDSADNIAVITDFMCNTLVNTCNADATAQATCAKAKTAAAAETPLQGTDADAFNAVFGIQTNFKNVEAINNTGVPVAGSTSGNETSAATASAASATSTDSTASSSAASSSGVGDFGSCSVPQIEFATGFDNRKETSFQPIDKASYNHGSAQAISIITQFMCDTLTNSCGADATAKSTCAQAQAAANAAPPKEGIDADIFNGFFGIKTNFASVAAVDDQGNVITGLTGSATEEASSTQVAATTAVETSVTTATTASATTATASTNQSTSGNLQTFTGNLGGVTAPAVVASNNQFQVESNSLFKSEKDALTRSCDVQHNQCANAANASGNKGDLTVAACGTQQSACNAANA